MDSKHAPTAEFLSALRRAIEAEGAHAAASKAAEIARRFGASIPHHVEDTEAQERAALNRLLMSCGEIDAIFAEYVHAAIAKAECNP
ncbi:MAG TPA: hypothetical protein VNP72_00065 [Longimicrobium sp.]|nr:hypothetical protein [Longimicrobium sp.]